MRVKTLYNITEDTKAKIEKIAYAIDLPASYALDYIVDNYFRIMWKVEAEKINKGCQIYNIMKLGKEMDKRGIKDEKE